MRVSHAQLKVLTTQLVDEENNSFGIDDRLKKNGMPIYVFEDTDAEWTVKDEGGRVEQALEGSRLAIEGDREINLDMGTRKSQLERNIERKRIHAAESWGEEDPDDETVQAKCLCVHGTCAEGRQECSGSCEPGWTGRYCDAPTASGDQQSSMRRPRGGDDYKDGVYRPQRVRDSESRSSTGSSWSSGSSSSSSSGSSIKKIDDDDWGHPAGGINMNANQPRKDQAFVEESSTTTEPKKTEADAQFM